jgi:hypothetical protein
MVAVLDENKMIVGAGCLIDGLHILTCFHVIEAALGRRPKTNNEVRIKLIGVGDGEAVRAKVFKLGEYARDARAVNDLALLKLSRNFGVPIAEFATPLRHAGKAYSALGFPDADPQGRNASGLLHAANADGLVQMDGNSALFVKGGFSGAPVWSRSLDAFVGIVVSELSDVGVAWCVPSRILCRFFPELPVRFRIAINDRPQIHDYRVDDPNVHIFGTISKTKSRLIIAKVESRNLPNTKNPFWATVTYECLPGSESSRGKFVTFITYPDFLNDREDNYELFGVIKNNSAKATFACSEGFTVAAIGDGGDTALTLNLSKLKNKPKRFK